MSNPALNIRSEGADARRTGTGEYPLSNDAHRSSDSRHRNGNEGNIPTIARREVLRNRLDDLHLLTSLARVHSALPSSMILNSVTAASSTVKVVIRTASSKSLAVYLPHASYSCKLSTLHSLMPSRCPLRDNERMLNLVYYEHSAL